MIAMNQQNKRRLAQDIVYIVAWIAVFVFLLWKCQYGYGNKDETFYLSVPYRLLQGDGLFIHEWHLSQMAGVLTMPFVALWLAINQGTEGIVLCMRITCTVIQCVIAIMLYVRFRKVDWIGAACASLCFALYIPFGIMALSYNSMGIMALIVTCMLLYGEKQRKSFNFFAGLSFAAAVLCCPYLLLLYFVYWVVVVLRMVAVKKGKLSGIAENTAWSLQSILYFTAGAVSAALAFAVFVFSRASFHDIMAALPEMLSDPEHPSVSLLWKVVLFFGTIVCVSPLSIVVYCVLGALFLWYFWDKNKARHRTVVFLIAVAGTVILMLNQYFKTGQINHAMFPLNVLGFFVFVLSGNKTIRMLFYSFWIPGILYAFCLHLSSNQVYYAITSASSVATFGSVLMVTIYACDCWKNVENDQLKRVPAYAVCIVLLLQLVLQVNLRYNAVFWEKGGMQTQTEYVSEGTQAGLYLSAECKEQYEHIQYVMKQIQGYSGTKVLFLSEKTGYYLMSDYRFATFSAWISGVDETAISRLKTYYALHPDRYPDIVYAEMEHESVAQLFATQFDYSIEYVTDGMILVPNA